MFSGATIVAHDSAGRDAGPRRAAQHRRLDRYVDYGDLRLALPSLTFADRLTLWAGDLRCELLFAGEPRAHDQ